jgi:hypothetical protein
MKSGGQPDGALKGSKRLHEVSFFARYIGNDYSGAATPNASLKGLRVYLANGELLPVEVPPPLVGIDHGFSFPLRDFEVHRLQPDWSAFLDDFQRHWPTDENIYVDFVRDGLIGNGSARTGSSRSLEDTPHFVS